jgi:predicted HAD superfamily Cof-like phosphohydrolase
MTNIFKDQATFMTACDQSVDINNKDQFKMYFTLIHEEVKELGEAVIANDRVETLDALIDILVVVTGALHSLGCDAQGAWNEVIRSNMSKVDPVSSKVIKREDGKVLKPESYSPPILSPYLK